MIALIITIVLVPIFFGIRIGIQDVIRGIGSDRRRARRQGPLNTRALDNWWQDQRDQA